MNNINENGNENGNGNENDNVCDFYMMITITDIIRNEKNEIEINKFVKDEIMSFLLTLNLYR
mgnify:CR=1 FL=1